MANRFLVSTTHHLLAIDPESAQLWRVHSGAGLYYGLAKGPEGLLYIACRNSIAGPDNDQVRASEEGTILVLDPAFRVRDELRSPFPLRDMHGIAFFDKRLWVTCSYDNMVAVYDPGTRDWTRWYPAPDPAHRDRDIHHFNTLGFAGGQIWLLAHRFGSSELLSYDYPGLQLASAVHIGVMAHDLFSFDNAIATCSSGEGWIVNRCGQRLRTGNFPRGIATTPEGNLLGMSLHSARDQRHLQGGVLRWYTSDWRFLTDYALPSVGMVLDVLELGDQAGAWSSLEPWPCAQVTRGTYNTLAPGNLYAPDSPAFGDLSQWYASEGTHRWMAARDTSLSILINPGETLLWVEVGSSNPNPYSCQILLDRQELGSMVFDSPGIQRREYVIPPGSTGGASLSFRVPCLWRPAELIPGNCDERLIGLAVRSVGVA